MKFTHESKAYRRKWMNCGAAKYNGAYYYSKEIVENIMPLVDTDRSWITVNVQGHGCDHAIVFVHNNIKPERYDWLSQYEDLVFVCGIPETVEKVKHLGKAIYVPLSVDVEYVKRFEAEAKTGDVCFAGRRAKRRQSNISSNIACLEGISRPELLRRMATYQRVYAVGRTAIEAKVLGCEVLPYDSRFPDPDKWEVLDNKEAAEILQKELDRIDGKIEEVKSDWSLNHMNKTALKEYADELGIELDPEMKKADMIEAIKENAGR